jgi:hypothetical protein
MPKFKHSIRSLMRQPLGHPADGRQLGLGLATAMAKQRDLIRLEVEDAERHLRQWAADERPMARR